MGMPVLLKTAWSMLTGKPILVECPESVSGPPFPPQLNAKLLLTRIQLLNGELGKPPSEVKRHKDFLTIQQEAIISRTELLNQAGFDLSILEPTRKESEVARFAKALDLSINDTRKILNYTP